MEEAFVLAYLIPGAQWPIESMTSRERAWLLERLKRQKVDEQKEIEKAQKKMREGGGKTRTI
jgi:predicted RNA polymerase sigma factor